MPSTATVPGNLLTSTAHYENFPVASVLVPRRLRPAIAAVYRFARHADDIADEGSAAPAQRLTELARLRHGLTSPGADPLTDALHPFMQRHQIGTEPFEDLLSAFEQDAGGATYPDRSSLLDYCRRSANPVGRIVLRIFDADRHQRLDSSDAICTALQLTNFVQDVAQDTARGRLYLPEAEMQAHDVDIGRLHHCTSRQRIDVPVRALLDTQIDYARSLFARGPALLGEVPGRLRFELAAIVGGGLRMLDRVAREDPFAARLKLGRSDGAAIGLLAARVLVQGRIPVPSAR